MQIIKKGFATLLAVMVTSTALANTQETCTADVNFLKNQVKLLDTSVKNLTGFMVSGKDKAQLATINELKIKVEALSQNYQNLLSKVQNHPSNDADYITVGTKRFPNPCNSFGTYKVSKEDNSPPKNKEVCVVYLVDKDDQLDYDKCKSSYQNGQFPPNFLISLENNKSSFPNIYNCQYHSSTTKEEWSYSYISSIRIFLVESR
ncbi:hypothetical protein ACWNT8_06760 [Pigmentibacter ruber]